MPCAPTHFDEITRKISYANSELIFRNNREKAVEMLKSVTLDLCVEKKIDEEKVTVKAIHNGRTILVDLQVEKSRISNQWLVTMTPYL